MVYPHTKIEEPIPGALPDWDDFRLLLSELSQEGAALRLALFFGATPLPPP